MNRVVRPVGRRIGRSRPVQATRRTRQRWQAGRTAAYGWFATRPRRQPGNGVRRTSLNRRRKAYALAAWTATHAWQRFLRGTGLGRSRTWHRANHIARTGWESFLLGTGLADPDKGIGDPFGPNAKPIGSRIGGPTSNGPRPGPTSHDPRPLVGVGAPAGPSQPSAAGSAASPSRTGGTPMANFAQPMLNVLPPILAGAKEAFQQACAQFHCVNSNGDLSAGAARQFLRELADFVEAAGTAVDQVGNKVVEEIYTLPGSADVFHQVGRYMAMPAQEIANSADMVDRVHDKEVERFNNDDRRANAWDRKVNRPDEF